MTVYSDVNELKPLNSMVNISHTLPKLGIL